MTIEDPTAPTTVRHDWVGDEAALPGVWRELGRLGRRARRRWLRTLAYALGCSALAVVAVARTPPAYVSRLILRATESPGHQAQRADDATMRERVARIVSANARLAAVRGDLVVEVWPPARVAVTLRGSDAQKVYDDLTELGRRVTGGHPDPRQRALRWELIDPPRVAPQWPSRATLLWWIGALAFVVALPLCAAAVGAFDPRVYDLADVERLGVPTLGAVRSFDGDNAGALATRLARGTIDPS
ncbi:MAG: hypothetical protein JWM53_3129 [bacterium]|nr:hypothetical protein [bacterium]